MANCKKDIFFGPWSDIVKTSSLMQPIRLQECLGFCPLRLSIIGGVWQKSHDLSVASYQLFPHAEWYFMLLFYYWSASGILGFPVIWLATAASGILRYLGPTYKKRFYFTICNIKLIFITISLAMPLHQKMDSHENYCYANEFYHLNASDNCEKQRIRRRNTGKTVTK